MCGTVSESLVMSIVARGVLYAGFRDVQAFVYTVTFFNIL